MTRSLVYAVYSSLVWLVAVALYMRALGSDEATRLLARVAVACVTAGTATFLISSLCARARLVGVAEYFVSLSGRTAIPCVCVFGGALTLGAQDFRSFAFRVLFAYLLTAPVHVLLSLPDETAFSAMYEEK